MNKLPYVHTASVTFSEPLVHVSVKPLKAFDLLGMSVLQNWFQTTLARILETTPVVVRLIKDGQSRTFLLFFFFWYSMKIITKSRKNKS